jgi:hypothetical protein
MISRDMKMFRLQFQSNHCFKPEVWRVTVKTGDRPSVIISFLNMLRRHDISKMIRDCTRRMRNTNSQTGIYNQYSMFDSIHSDQGRGDLPTAVEQLPA